MDKNDGAASLVRSDALLAEALTLLDRIYATWCSDGNNDEFVDALDGLMEDTKRFLEAHTANNGVTGVTTAGRNVP